MSDYAAPTHGATQARAAAPTHGAARARAAAPTHGAARGRDVAPTGGLVRGRGIVPGEEDRLISERAIRPSIPLVFWTMAGCWVTMALAEQLLWLRYTGIIVSGPIASSPGTVAVVLMVVSLLVMVAIAYVTKLSDGSEHAHIMSIAATACLLVACALLACGVGMLYWTDWESQATRLEAISKGKKSLEVTSDATESVHGWSSDGRVLLDDGQSIPIRLYWNDEDDIVDNGYHFEAYGNITPTRATDKGHKAHQKGICGSMTVYNPRSVQPAPGLVGLIAPLRVSMGRVLDGIGGQGSALIAGVLLGDRSSLANSTVEDDFRTCGLSHMLAVSGSHLVIVGALVSWVLSRLRAGKAIRSGVLVAFLITYVVLSGLQISALRACGMTAVGLLSQFTSRRRHSLTACSICVIVLLMVGPDAAFSFSLLLSASAVCGIIVFAPLFSEWIAAALHGHARFLVEPTALTLSAQLSTLAITVPTFCVVSIISPVANVVVTPLLTLLLGASLVCAGLLALPFVPAVIPAFLLAGCSAFGNLVCRIVACLADVPGAARAASWPEVATVACCIILCVLIWVVWPHPSRRRLATLSIACSAVCLIAVVSSLFAVRGQFVMLDVGQGDALLLRSGYGCMLVDTGQYDAKLLSALARNGVTHLDAVFITHLDSDHCGALSALGGTVGVDRIFFTDGDMKEGFVDSDAVVTARDIAGVDDVCSLSVGDVVSLGSWNLEVISPAEFTDDGGNQDSLVMLATYDDDGDGGADESMLLTGDAEHETLSRLEDEGMLPDVDVFKVGHHGSSASCEDEDVAALSPLIALVSVGAGNDYGHPTAKALATLEASGAAVFRTDQDGDVHLEFEGGAITVTCGG